MKTQVDLLNEKIEVLNTSMSKCNNIINGSISELTEKISRMANNFGSGQYQNEIFDKLLDEISNSNDELLEKINEKFEMFDQNFFDRVNLFIDEYYSTNLEFDQYSDYINTKLDSLESFCEENEMSKYLSAIQDLRNLISNFLFRSESAENHSIPFPSIEDNIVFESKENRGDINPEITMAIENIDLTIKKNKTFVKKIKDEVKTFIEIICDGLLHGHKIGQETREILLKIIEEFDKITEILKAKIALEQYNTNGKTPNQCIKDDGEDCEIHDSILKIKKLLNSLPCDLKTDDARDIQIIFNEITTDELEDIPDEDDCIRLGFAIGISRKVAGEVSTNTVWKIIDSIKDIANNFNKELDNLLDSCNNSLNIIRKQLKKIYYKFDQDIWNDLNSENYIENNTVSSKCDSKIDDFKNRIINCLNLISYDGGRELFNMLNQRSQEFIETHTRYHNFKSKFFEIENKVFDIDHNNFANQLEEHGYHLSEENLSLYKKDIDRYSNFEQSTAFATSEQDDEYADVRVHAYIKRHYIVNDENGNFIDDYLLDPTVFNEVSFSCKDNNFISSMKNRLNDLVEEEKQQMINKESHEFNELAEYMSNYNIVKIENAEVNDSEIITGDVIEITVNCTAINSNVELHERLLDTIVWGAKLYIDHKNNVDFDPSEVVGNLDLVEIYYIDNDGNEHIVGYSCNGVSYETLDDIKNSCCIVHLPFIEENYELDINGISITIAHPKWKNIETKEVFDPGTDVVVNDYKYASKLEENESCITASFELVDATN